LSEQGQFASFANEAHLSEQEQRLLALARDRTPLAEVAVRLGVPIAEADRRIALLCAKLGVPDRAALQSPSIDEEEEPGETPLADEQQPVTQLSPKISRRAVLTGAGVVGTLAAAGMSGWILRHRSGDSNAGKRPFPAANTPASTVTTVVARGAALITPAPDAFEIRTFAPGELIDWHSGAFFMNTESGQIAGYRAGRSGEPQIGDTSSAGGGRWVLSFGNDPIGLALDRTTGRSWGWPNEQLTPVAVSGTHFVFAERGPSGPTPTGNHFVVSADMQPVSEVSFANATWSNWLLGDGVAVVVTGDVPEPKTVNLASGHQDVLFSPPLTSADGKQRWQIMLKRESPQVLVATVGYYAPDPTKRQPSDFQSPTWLIQRLRWDGTLLDSHWATGLFVEQECASPDGHYRLREQYLHQVPPMGEGSGEYWPAAVVLDSGGNPLLRVRSAGLQYGDNLPFERWLADSSGFVALFRGEGESTGYDFFRYGIVRQIGSLEFLPAPPVRPDDWFNSHWNAGPVPSPTGRDLLSFGRFYLYNLERSSGRFRTLPTRTVRRIRSAARHGMRLRAKCYSFLDMAVTAADQVRP
jgi:hypothetical protein